MAAKQRSDGFLLVELLVVLTMSVFLFGIAAYWQGLIIQTRHKAINRLKMAALVRNLIEEMQKDGKLINNGNRLEGEVTISWQRLIPVMSSVDLPRSLILPSSFKLIKIKASQKVTYGNPLLMELVTGVIDAKS